MATTLLYNSYFSMIARDFQNKPHFNAPVGSNSTGSTPPVQIKGMPRLPPFGKAQVIRLVKLAVQEGQHFPGAAHKGRMVPPAENEAIRQGRHPYYPEVVFRRIRR